MDNSWCGAVSIPEQIDEAVEAEFVALSLPYSKEEMSRTSDVPEKLLPAVRRHHATSRPLCPLIFS